MNWNQVGRLPYVWSAFLLSVLTSSVTALGFQQHELEQPRKHSRNNSTFSEEHPFGGNLNTFSPNLKHAPAPIPLCFDLPAALQIEGGFIAVFENDDHNPSTDSDYCFGDDVGMEGTQEGLGWDQQHHTISSFLKKVHLEKNKVLPYHGQEKIVEQKVLLPNSKYLTGPATLPCNDLWVMCEYT